MNRLLTYLILLIASAGCGGNNCEDPFYSASHGYDVWSIPMIEPLWLGSTTGVDGTWYINVPFESEQDVDNSYRAIEFSSRNAFIMKFSELTTQVLNFHEVGGLYNEKSKKGYLEWYPEEFKACKLK